MAESALFKLKTKVFYYMYFIIFVNTDVLKLIFWMALLTVISTIMTNEKATNCQNMQRYISETMNKIAY